MIFKKFHHIVKNFFPISHIPSLYCSILLFSSSDDYSFYMYIPRLCRWINVWCYCVLLYTTDDDNMHNSRTHFFSTTFQEKFNYNIQHITTEQQASTKVYCMCTFIVKAMREIGEREKQWNFFIIKENRVGEKML